MMGADKFCLISINSYNELTGGGVYLRTIVSFLNKQNVELTLIDKNISEKNFDAPVKKHISLSKGLFQDIISRIFLLPSFYMVHFFTILRVCHGNDFIGIHNSRLGIVCYFLKLIFPKKKIILFTDNFEYNLICQKKTTIVSLYEKLIIRLNENLGLYISDLVAYITENDRKLMNAYYKGCQKQSLIIPVVFEVTQSKNAVSAGFIKKINILNADCRRKLVFTASFDFFPNIDAVYRIMEKAKDNKGLVFVLAGRKLSDLSLEKNDNVYMFENLSNSEMSRLLSVCDVFYSPLMLGSGMKTKVAEALSYGLHVYGSQQTMIGYEEIIDNKECVTLISDISEPLPVHVITGVFDKAKICLIQKKHYSSERFDGDELNNFFGI
ncbi:glycosyltransferase [Citrobacter braakii]|uniref:glycosyltransferase n=1 Tax=Citrobacter braakii TaxID=57706 RepID=UPI0019061AF2|nr:glycosyltransferase [Citrobacter braakii]MBJ8848334.1 glycosyltransferase [Citrobacter braakii]